ncbi:MAG: exopolyphosphatase / guanosine-5-triphosphate,3-diphosphate pyrophosphatase [Solirubrobacteraceae bacterium]|nr:exopolyphosphatase / guanosine-5-triphosphate,3-diphosphate pyrophosphatase [Solirubrobacteraceae bacterium]
MDHDKIDRHPVARCACIDVGSNTTRLLVAMDDDGRRLREVFSERAFTRLGAARGNDGEIRADKVAEVAAVVARQVATARRLGAQDVRIVATAAVREAGNAAALTAAVDRECGARLEILDGVDEARLAFAGAVGMLAERPAGLLGVVDVGGGSTELVVGTWAGGVTWSVSLPVGSSVVTEADLPTDPPSPAELARLRRKLARVFADVEAPRPVRAYAVGGSATSLRRLVGGIDLERDALARGLQALVTRPAEEIALALGLHPERARLLPAAILLLDAASHALQAPLQLAGGGLREGVVLEQLARLRAH